MEKITICLKNNKNCDSCNYKFSCFTDGFEPLEVEFHKATKQMSKQLPSLRRYVPPLDSLGTNSKNSELRIVFKNGTFPLELHLINLEIRLIFNNGMTTIFKAQEFRMRNFTNKTEIILYE